MTSVLGDCLEKNVGIGNTYPPGETQGQGKEVKLAPNESRFRFVSKC